MRYNYIVLGSGRQGTAAAYDLATRGKAKSITLCDISYEALSDAFLKLQKLINPKIEIVMEKLNTVADEPLSTGKFHAGVCALPYEYGEGVAKAALKAKVPICDLGCDTEIVKKQLKLNAKAKRAGVAIVPDCGLAPGTSTMFAIYVFRKVKNFGGQKPRSVHVYCGGLPKYGTQDGLPLGYKIVFSLEGLMNNYRQSSWILRDKKVLQVPGLSEVEKVKWIDSDIMLEAFHTAGGASVLPWKFKKLGLRDYSYKTLRYPGHADNMALFKQLGLLDDEDWAKAAWKEIGKRLAHQRVPDHVYLSATCVADTKNSSTCEYRLGMDATNDAQTGFSAMERTTGFAAGIVAHLLARKKIKPGVHTPDDVVDPDYYIDELKKRGFKLRESALGDA